jgi:NTE family protein
MAAPQVGMLWALVEAGVIPDFVVGSSAGALNAVAFASDPTPGGLDRLEALWMSLRRKHVAAFSARTLLGAVAGRNGGLLSPDGLRRMVATSFVATDFLDTVLPAYVVATELATAEPVVLSEGDTMSALLASSAFPGLYPPVQVGQRLLIDGGVAADVPVLQAEQLGSSVTYVLPAAGSDDTRALPHGPLSLAYHALGQILDATARRDAAAARGTVHLLPAPSSRASNPVDFRGTARLIDEGYRLASEWMADQVSAAVQSERADLAGSAVEYAVVEQLAVGV